MAHPATNTLGVDAFGLVMGLGFVLSFGYWCTDFLVVQRAMAADSEVSARRVPLIAAIPKMLFPFLVILPGLIAVSVTSHMAAFDTTTETPTPCLSHQRPRSGSLRRNPPVVAYRRPPARHHPRQNRSHSTTSPSSTLTVPRSITTT